MNVYLSLGLLAVVAVLGVFGQNGGGPGPETPPSGEGVRLPDGRTQRVGGPGRGRGGRRGPGGRFRPRLDLANSDAVFYGWNRTVDNANVFQRAISSQSDNRVIIGTMGRNLESLGLSRGGILYDFSGATPMRVVRDMMRCYVLPARDPDTATFDATVTELQTRNGSTVTTVLPEDQVLAAASALSETDRASFVEANPTIGTFCRFADIYETTDPTAADPFPAAGAEPEGQSVTSFLTFDDEVSILAATQAPFMPPFFGGSGRPGRPGRPGRLNGNGRGQGGNRGGQRGNGRGQGGNRRGQGGNRRGQGGNRRGQNGNGRGQGGNRRGQNGNGGSFGGQASLSIGNQG